MFRCRIADLNVMVDGNSKEFPARAESYAFDFRCRADIEASAGREEILRYKKAHPELRTEACADFLAGRAFFCGLLSYDGFMLRGSAVSDRGKAYLFSPVYPSKNQLYADCAGKVLGTESSCVLSTECAAIRFTEGNFFFYKTPWDGGGEADAEPKLPVGAVLFTVPSDTPYLRRIRPGEFLRFFFPQTVRPVKTELMPLLLGAFIRMTERLPVYVAGTGKKAAAAEATLQDFFAELGAEPAPAKSAPAKSAPAERSPADTAPAEPSPSET